MIIFEKIVTVAEDGMLRLRIEDPRVKAGDIVTVMIDPDLTAAQIDALKRELGEYPALGPGEE